jgi:uncharacterized protein YcbK (DUF882 family)
MSKKFSTPLQSDQVSSESRRLSRRRFFVGAGALAVSGAMPRVSLASASKAEYRSLRLVGLHTGERLDVTYFEHGRYIPDALAAINLQLRDHRTDDVYPMEVALLDTLWELASLRSGKATFEVISGYRSPKTNQRLASRSSGVAKRSFHMRGMAIDVRIPGVSTSALRDAAVAMRRGGVGYYPRDRFVHLDIGRPRQWGQRA